MNHIARTVATAILAAIATIPAFAAPRQQDKKAPSPAEDQVRLAAFGYYYANAFGDADKYLQVTRLPVYVVRDGSGAYRDEKQCRALLAKLAEHAKSFTDENRQVIAKNLLTAVGDGSVQFVGANTATIAIPLSLHATADEPQRILTLTLYRKDGAWKVISELTDSTPVPPDYVNK